MVVHLCAAHNPLTTWDLQTLDIGGHYGQCYWLWFCGMFAVRLGVWKHAYTAVLEYVLHLVSFDFIGHAFKESYNVMFGC